MTTSTFDNGCPHCAGNGGVADAGGIMHRCLWCYGRGHPFCYTASETLEHAKRLSLALCLLKLQDGSDARHPQLQRMEELRVHTLEMISRLVAAGVKPA